MPDVPKHAWTHRPKAQGGTDPIEIPTGSGPASALAIGSSTTTSITGNNLINFGLLARSPGSGYEADTADPTDFEYIMIPEDGWYMADFHVFFFPDFTAGQNPYIEPAAVVAGFDTDLTTLVDYSWDNTSGWIGGEQFATSELAHNQLVCRVWFSYEAAEVDPSFGIGVRLRSSAAVTKDIGGSVAVTRLGDALELVT